jgi:CelD/BcsL family acetyltransferase involved in cellulose biosynthesis
MRIDIIDTHQALLDLKENWDAVYESDPEGQFFLSWTWISNWLDGDRSQWFILAAAPEGSSEYVAFFPLRLRTKMRKRGGFYNEITLAGRGLSDYSGIITHPDHEADAVAALSRYLRRSNWAALTLEFYRSSRGRLERLLRSFPVKEFRRNEIPAVNKRDNVNNLICPYIALPDTWDDYLGRLGSNTRQKMRRFLRKVDDGDEYRITVANADTVERDLDILMNFWSTKWTPRKGDRMPGLVRVNRSMFKACFDAGALFLPVMWQGDKPLGALSTLIDHQKKTFLFFLAGRDETVRTPVPSGVALHAYSLRHAVTNGIKTYDFLRGNEEYKYMFGVEEIQLHNLVVTTPGHENLGGKLDPRCILRVLSQTVRFHKADKLGHAELGYRQVLRVSPKSPAALYGYGQLLMRKGDPRGAARMFRKLVDVKPNERKAWLRLAAALEADKRYADAAKAYRQLIHLAPADAEVYAKLAQTLLALGKTHEAGSALQTASSLQHGQDAFVH